jgi:chromosome partitioning protein
MRTLALVAEKGGSGKSLIAVHLAVCAVRRRQRVVLIDLDRQKNVCKWGERRKSDDVTITAARVQELPGLIASARRQEADLVILDTPGRADIVSAQVLDVADVVLVPCRPFVYDVDATEETVAAIKRAKVQRAAFVLNSVPSRGTRHVEARAALEQLMPVCPVELHYLMPFTDALNDGRSVEEIDAKSKAAVEIRALYRWLGKP